MSNPIGVFDSGVGGLTVVKELVNRFPKESIVYFGDTARVPYGIKSKETVERFAVEDMTFLMRSKPKLVVVACNTASANAMDRLQKEFDCPIIDVVRPGASQACSETKTGRIGLIATEATVKSKAYEKEVNRLDSDMRVFSRACPLLVPLVEEGRTADDPIVHAVVWEYLSEFEGLDLDTLVLGCTHYPIIKDAIARCMNDVTIVDSASATAKAVSDHHADLLVGDEENSPTYTFYVSDNPDRFQEIGKRMTGLPLDDVRLVDLADIVTA